MYQISGLFSGFVWRDEKDGNSIFIILSEKRIPGAGESSLYMDIKGADHTFYKYTVKCQKVPDFSKWMPVSVSFESIALDGDIPGQSIRPCGDRALTEIYLIQTHKKGAGSIASEMGEEQNIYDFSLTEKAGEVMPAKELLALRRVQEIGKVVQLSDGADLDMTVISKAVKMYGTDTAQKLKENPYLYGSRAGFGFTACDRIALNTGKPSVWPERAHALAETAMEQITNNGNIWVPVKDLVTTMNGIERRGAFSENSSASVLYPFVASYMGHKKIHGVDAVYSQTLLLAEERIARNIKRLSATASTDPAYTPGLIEKAETYNGMKMGTQQRAAFAGILSDRKISLLIGGPGTGKTSTIKNIHYGYMCMHPSHKVLLCAPTGRAAQRLSESTGYEAVTIHRGLDYKPYEGGSSCKGPGDPIDADLIIVDEMSMCDSVLFDMLLMAVKPGTKLILVGDKNQLEAVGPGFVLGDLMKAPKNLVRCYQLTEVFRQKGGSPIIENAQLIQAGRGDLRVTQDFGIESYEDPYDMRARIIDCIRRTYDITDPFKVQVLCPALEGVNGVNALNSELQATLNPSTAHGYIQYGATQFRINDKVIMKRNNYDLGYYNGDVGIVSSVIDGTASVRIRGESFDITRDLLADMSLAYAMTIHKSQGSEFQSVVVVLPEKPENMLVRNLFYTGITRAKKEVLVVSQGQAMNRAISRNRNGKRRTILLDELMK